MTVPASTVHSQSSYGVAGRAAIASGAIGIIAFGLLIAFLVKRILGGTEQICIPIIRAHDVAAILQFVLMVPVVFALNDIATRAANGRGRTPFLIGVGSIALFTLFVDRAHLLGWTPFDYQPPPGTDMANGLSHILLIIGTFTGLTTLPIWAALVGRRLLKAS
jgi:hypothetical protein